MLIKKEWVKPASNLTILLAKKIGKEIIVEEDGARLVAYAVGDTLYVSESDYKERKVESKPKFKVGDRVKVVQSGYGVAAGDLGKETVITGVANTGSDWGVEYYYSTKGFSHNYPINYGQDIYKAYECSFELVTHATQDLIDIPYHSITYSEGSTKIHIDGKLSRATVDGIVKLLHENRVA